MDAAFDGEIVGAIGSGIFVRFDGIFEGYVPARRLAGDYFELNPLEPRSSAGAPSAPTASVTG